MPFIKKTSYKPTLLFKNKHFNTVYRTFFNNYNVNFRRERLELIDGDFMDLDISSVNSEKVVVAIHGLEGSSNSTYILSLCKVLNQHNFDVIAMNLRGCSGESNRLLSSYHSGKTEDLDFIIQHLIKKYNYNDINIVGYSLGGNLTFKYIAEQEDSSKIRSAVGVSVPCDLKTSALQMNTFSNTLYLQMFLKSLKKKALQKSIEFPDSFLTKASITAIKNFKDFDDIYTAPAHGFKNAEDYWANSSCKQYIPSIKIPTLLITAFDDPFLGPACYPIKEAEANDYFFTEATKYGGHVGFGTHLNVDRNIWCENRILSFLTQLK